MQAETFGLQSGYTSTGQPGSIQVKKERLFFPNQWGSGSLEGLGQQFMEDGKKAGFTGAEAKGDGAKRCDFPRKEWICLGARQA